MAFALGSLMVVERFGGGVAPGGERGQEHGVFEPVVAATASGLTSQGGAGLAGGRGQVGVGGDFAVSEGGAVADLGEDTGAGPRPDPWHARQQLTERVGREHLLDLARQRVAARADPVQLGGEFGNNAAGGVYRFKTRRVVPDLGFYDFG